MSTLVSDEPRTETKQDQLAQIKATEVELGSINSLRVTASDVSAVDLDLPSSMHVVTLSIRTTKTAIVSLMDLGEMQLLAKVSPLEQRLGL